MLKAGHRTLPCTLLHNPLTQRLVTFFLSEAPACPASNHKPSLCLLFLGIGPTGRDKSAQRAKMLADSTSQAWLTAHAPAGPGQQAAWAGQGSAGLVRMSPGLGLPGQQGQAGHPYLGSLGGMPGSVQVRHPCTGKLGLCSAQ